ncbi:MAG: hypothetical protein BM563_09380 [Bacteroidetes bacterium MedPE-SWsnd-G1]|nr:MAG: hypothetical protein BM563_09380 [Bacteroidetes bacterium MedPE-SWsnd-G1]
MILVKKYSSHIIKLILVGILIIGVYSCNVGTEYVRPEQNIAQEYNEQFPKDSAISNIPWWKLFKDPVLVNLIDSALVNNKDVKMAALRIQQSQLALDISKADLYPSINYGVVGSSSVNSENSKFSNSVSPVVNVSYTIDFWHKIKNLNEIALQNYLATEEAYRALQMGLISAVSQAYIGLRDLDNRLSISEKTAKNFQANLDVMQARSNAGMISDVDLYQAKIQLSEAQTAVEVFERSRVQIENSISILLGSTPVSIERGLPLYEQLSLPEVPVGVPSELLDRRPDILIAERNLNAQTINIGVTEALKYPSITLSADLGAEVVNPSLLFASFGAQILGPIFNSGKIKKSVEIEKLKTEELLNNYQYTFINAVKEVEDAMIAVETYNNEYALRNDQMQMATKAAELSWVRYDGGLTSYLEVLNLQSSQFNAELRASEAFKQEMISLVKLYEALGGGWTTDESNIPNQE